MNAFIINKENLIAFLESLKTKRLYAPVSNHGKTAFQEIKESKSITLDLENYTASPKNVLFPQTEILFTFKTTESTIHMKPEDNTLQTVIFGIRPCDARGFTILDPLFEGKDYKDPYYLQRRHNTTIIAVACTEPTNRCFCPSLGGSPSSSEGVDVLFTDIQDAYFVEVFTENGREILNHTQSLFVPANDEHQKKKKLADKEALTKIKRQANVESIHEKLPKTFEHTIWKSLANKCIGCGICTYYCPTCHCFDIQDETMTDQGRRIRLWDSCMFEEFTRHASGVNPRHNRSDRLRNRIMHKFSYYPENFGYIACVGCGRCIELCPVNEDIIEILNIIRETDA